MKRITFILLAVLLLGIKANAQIVFEEGTFSSVMKKAKKEKKLIFIDTYTSWCGPCKMMLSNIFPLKEVSDFYNTNFICYKVDAEKGEGKDIAKKFEVKAFPTYLFVDGDGTLFYRSSGSMPAEKFIEEGYTAVALFKDKKSMAQWDKEYLQKKGDAHFLRDYIAKRSLLKLDNSELCDEYVKLCNGDNNLLFHKDFITCLYGQDAKINAGGPCFNFIIDNCDKVVEVLQTDKPMFLYNLPFLTTLYSMKKASANSDELLFKQTVEGAVRLAKLMGEQSREHEYEIKCYYYSKTAQVEKLEEAASIYAGFLLQAMPECLSGDEKAFVEFVKPLSEGNAERFKGRDAGSIAKSFSYAATNKASDLSFKFRDLVLQTAPLTKNIDLRHKCVEWALIAYKLFDNFSNTEAVSEAYFQLGNNKEAKFWIDLALAKIPALAGDDIRSRVQERASRIR